MSSGPDQTPAAPQQGGSQGVWRHVTHPGWKVGGAMIATAASVLSIVVVVSQLVGGGGGSSCSVESATLGEAVSERMTLGQFLRSTGVPVRKRKGLDQPVERVQLGISIAGYRKQHLRLEWTMIDVAKRAPFADPSLQNQGALELQPTVCETNADAIFMTPAPTGPAVLEVALKNGGDVLTLTRTGPLES